MPRFFILRSVFVSFVAALIFSALGAHSAAVYVMAEEITGELGTPDATTTISGKQLPPPDPKFEGE